MDFTPEDMEAVQACLDGIHGNVPVAVEPAAATVLLPHRLPGCGLAGASRVASRATSARRGTLAARCRGKAGASPLTQSGSSSASSSLSRASSSPSGGGAGVHCVHRSVIGNAAQSASPPRMWNPRFASQLRLSCVALMTSQAKQYWSYARECELWATSVADERDRAIFAEMQQAWAGLAVRNSSAFKTARDVEDALGRAHLHSGVKQPRAFPRRKAVMVLALAGIFFAGMTADAFLLTSGNRLVAATLFSDATASLSSFCAAFVYRTM